MRFATLVSSLFLAATALSLLVTPSQAAAPEAAEAQQQRVLAPKKPTRKPTRKPTAAPISVVGQKIAKYAPGNVNAFVLGSYQKKALTFIETIPSASSLSDAKAVQYYALMCLYYSTFGVTNPAWKASNSGVPPGWNITTNWLSKTVDPCSGWLGITCSSNKVTKIVLSSNRLIGSVPFEITLLASNNPSGAGSLATLDLFNNPYLINIGEAQLTWIGSLGPSMKYLYFGSTAMFTTTGVPTGISKLVNLVEFDCSFTLIAGPLVGSTFSPLTKLEYLELEGNAFNSSIPTQIGALPSLKYLYVVYANVNGDLSFIKSMKKVTELWVDQNSIGGSIPTTIGLSTALKSLSLSRNQLVGSIPTQMAKLSNMEQMWLYSNKLSGGFPSFLSTMKKLTLLHMESNPSITGSASSLCSAVGTLKSIGVDCPSKVTCSGCTGCCCSVSQCSDL